MYSVDCVVVGAGVVGLAIARALALAGREVLVLERNDGIGQETSSRNSEVVHAGIYYAPGSLKAQLCVAGRELLYSYARERGLEHRRCGKLIVGGEHQVEALRMLAANAERNGVADLRMIDKSEIRNLEPALDVSVALLSPSSGIIDSHALMLALQGDIENAGGNVLLRSPVLGGSLHDDRVRVSVGGADPIQIECRLLVNAAGLHAQTLAARLGVPSHFIPAQHFAIGHYYTLSGRNPFQRLVYPVPEDGGLGVHVTIDMGGQAKFGPDVRWIDRIDYSFDDSKRDRFVAAIRQYYPGLDEARLQPGYTGIRPKLAGPGQASSDFQIDLPAVTGIPRLVSLYGIESPGLTSSLAIGNVVCSAVQGIK